MAIAPPAACLREGGVVVGGGAREQRLAVRRVLGEERAHGRERGGQRAQRSPCAGLLQNVGLKRRRSSTSSASSGWSKMSEKASTRYSRLGEDLDRRRDLDPVLRVRGDAAVVALGGLGHRGAVVGAREQVVAAGLGAERDRDQRRRLAAGLRGQRGQLADAAHAHVAQCRVRRRGPLLQALLGVGGEVEAHGAGGSARRCPR